jgi:hypothetical protein
MTSGASRQDQIDAAKASNEKSAPHVATSRERDAAWFRKSAVGVPTLAIFVSIYHSIILVAALWITTFCVEPSSLIQCTPSPTEVQSVAGAAATLCKVVHWRVITFAFLFGALGSALAASRYVVFAVRHSVYDSRRVLWQLLSPLHGGVLAVIAMYVIFGGLLAIARSPSPTEQYGFFVGGLSFIVGFSSELFVKRLIRATEALFGEEPNNIDTIDGRHGPGESTQNEKQD